MAGELVGLKGECWPVTGACVFPFAGCDTHSTVCRVPWRGELPPAFLGGRSGAQFEAGSKSCAVPLGWGSPGNFLCPECVCLGAGEQHPPRAHFPLLAASVPTHCNHRVQLRPPFLSNGCLSKGAPTVMVRMEEGLASVPHVDLLLRSSHKHFEQVPSHKLQGEIAWLKAQAVTAPPPKKNKKPAHTGSLQFQERRKETGRKLRGWDFQRGRQWQPSPFLLLFPSCPVVLMAFLGPALQPHTPHRTLAQCKAWERLGHTLPPTPISWLQLQETRAGWFPDAFWAWLHSEHKKSRSA